MGTKIWPASPPEDLNLNIGADISFGSAVNAFTGAVMHIPNLNIGGATKGVIDSIVYVMFEINEPIGTKFTKISFHLEFLIGTGAGAEHTFYFGLLEKDGHWDLITPPFLNLRRGVGNYLVLQDFPQPNGTSPVDSLWVSGSASIEDAFPQPFLPIGSTYSWGSVGTGSTFEDDKFLADFQIAFDANEGQRSPNGGIPIMTFMRTTDPKLRLHRFGSQNSAVEAERPTLVLTTRRIFIV